jgi:hypothetical protein
MTQLINDCLFHYHIINARLSHKMSLLIPNIYKYSFVKIKKTRLQTTLLKDHLDC